MQDVVIWFAPGIISVRVRERGSGQSPDSDGRENRKEDWRCIRALRTPNGCPDWFSISRQHYIDISCAIRTIVPQADTRPPIKGPANAPNDAPIPIFYRAINEYSKSLLPLDLENNSFPLHYGYISFIIYS